MKILNLKNIFYLIITSLAVYSLSCYSQDLSHRKSDLKLTVTDEYGSPIPNAVIDVQMKKHTFKFGTQVNYTIMLLVIKIILFLIILLNQILILKVQLIILLLMMI